MYISLHNEVSDSSSFVLCSLATHKKTQVWLQFFQGPQTVYMESWN